MSADTVNIFNSATTKLAAYYSGNEWRRRGSTENIGNMPVFSHEPLTITRKAGSDVTAVVIGEVSLKNQKLVVPTFNSLLHTRLPLSQTLAEIALQLPDDAVINIPADDKMPWSRSSTTTVPGNVRTMERMFPISPSAEFFHLLRIFQDTFLHHGVQQTSNQQITSHVLSLPFHQCFHRLRSLSGEIALADSFNISNDDSSAYSLINSLGEPLNAGNAILGTFSSGTWSYDVTTSRWNFQGNSYAQDQLKYSDLMSMQNNFTSALTNIPEEQNGGVADGRFNLSGDYSSSLTSPVYLMVTGQDGETALLSLKTYPATVCLITII